jgi:formate-dependent nitrite reductase membrane component NrfD
MSAITGATFATYTGVLLGATAIPVLEPNAGPLPVHFSLSGMSAAASSLELRGLETPALNRNRNDDRARRSNHRRLTRVSKNIPHIAH